MAAGSGWSWRAAISWASCRPTLSAGLRNDWSRSDADDGRRRQRRRQSASSPRPRALSPRMARARSPWRRPTPTAARPRSMAGRPPGRGQRHRPEQRADRRGLGQPRSGGLLRHRRLARRGRVDHQLGGRRGDPLERRPEHFDHLLGRDRRGLGRGQPGQDRHGHADAVGRQHLLAAPRPSAAARSRSAADANLGTPPVADSGPPDVQRRHAARLGHPDPRRQPRHRPRRGGHNLTQRERDPDLHRASSPAGHAGQDRLRHAQPGRRQHLYRCHDDQRRHARSCPPTATWDTPPGSPTAAT